MSSTILVVDDDPIQRRLLENTLQRLGYAVLLAQGGEEALACLAGPAGRDVDMMILDLVMPDLDGMGVLGRLRDLGRRVPTVVQTAHGSVETVISAMRAGAVDFIVKPVGVERLAISVKNALRMGALEQELRLMHRQAAGLVTFADLACRSEEMGRAIRLAERACRSPLPVLIEGEAGVGKEMLARAIQGASDRKGRGFVAVNCAGTPAGQIEALLFGQEKGAGTAPSERQIGKFVEAHGGTLFLQEIGALPLDVQARVLRAVQEGEIEPAGARRPVRVDARLIAATSENLIELVKQGRFREDLFYRLNVFPITLPPLRARRDDIAELARRFAARFAAEEGKSIRGLSAELLALLGAYDWPGNVRQLENAVFRAVVMCEGDELGVAEFPQIASRLGGFDLRVPALPPAPRLVAARAPEPAPVRDPSALALLGDDGHMRTLAALEEEAIRFALQHYRSHMTEMARRLGIGRSTLYRKLKDLGIEEAVESAA